MTTRRTRGRPIKKGTVYQCVQVLDDAPARPMAHPYLKVVPTTRVGRLQRSLKAGGRAAEPETRGGRDDVAMSWREALEEVGEKNEAGFRYLAGR